VLNPKDTWIGKRFKHGPEGKDTKMSKQMGFKKSILPTRTMFQAGLHMGGACKLESPWINCNENSSTSCNIITLSNGSQSNINHIHKFNEKVLDADTKRMNPESEGMIYHYMLRANRHFNVVASKDALTSENEYVTRFYKNVMKQLHVRGLELLVTLPDKLDKITPVSSTWKSFNAVYKSTFP
jgi:hypothetical protein